jgi:hypothetical protein
MLKGMRTASERTKIRRMNPRGASEVLRATQRDRRRLELKRGAFGRRGVKWHEESKIKSMLDHNLVTARR